ncbi:MAG: hypothetical protein ACTSVI_09275 [Promethearchaeota archaeon]
MTEEIKPKKESMQSRDAGVVENKVKNGFERVLTSGVSGSNDGSNEGHLARDTWRDALIQSLLLFSYLFIPGKELRSAIDKKSNKLVLVSIFMFLGSILFVSLGLQGMLDGPEVIHEFILGNLMVHSQTLLDAAIVTYGFLLMVVSLMAILLPFIITSLMNLSYRKEQRRSIKSIFLASGYSILSIIFYTPIILLIAVFAVWENPFLSHLLDRSWWNSILYAFLLSLIIGMIGYSVMLAKFLKFNKVRCWLSFFLMFTSVVLILVPFVI